MIRILPVMEKSLKDHVLEEIPAGEFKAFWMRKPGTGNYAVLLVFTPAGIVVAGDIGLSTENNRGVVSDPGYGLDWFAGELGEDYLCSKFFRDVHWDRERAAEWCTAHAQEVLEGEHDSEAWDGDPAETLRKNRSLLARDFRVLTQALESCSVETEDDFGRELRRLRHDFEDLPGRGYPSAQAGWLCAIQRRFAELHKTATSTEAKR